MSAQLADVKAQLKIWGDRFNELSLRERGLLFLALMGVLYFLVSSVAFAPLHKERRALEQQVVEKQKQVRLFDEQINQIATGNNQGTAEQRAKLAAAQARLKALDDEFANVTRRLVPPREMAQLIEQMLTKNRNLQLVRMENVAATPLLDVSQGGIAGAPALRVVYKHGMRVQVKGSYADIRSYLHALENLPWRMFWGEIELVTKDYPTSTATFVVYTLSLKEGWIGV